VVISMTTFDRRPARDMGLGIGRLSADWTASANSARPGSRNRQTLRRSFPSHDHEIERIVERAAKPEPARRTFGAAAVP